MKKAIKRFWGIGLIVIILSSFFMAVPVAPASGSIYAWAADSTQPTVSNGLLATAGQSINSISQTSNGANIFVTTTANTLLQSTNGGQTWTQMSATAFPGSGRMSLVAVAPDSSSIVAIASANTSTVYLSTNGGSSFSSLGVPAASMVFKGLAISAQGGPFKWIGVVGNNGTTPAPGSGGGLALAWPYGSAAPSWINTFTNASPPYTFSSTAPTSIDDVTSVAFSSSFPSDSTMLVTTVTVGDPLTPARSPFTRPASTSRSGTMLSTPASRDT